jgi:broad specificity phosphatase PhoE
VEVAGMSEGFPTVVLVRHGETGWSREGKHTGRTDLPLTAEGEERARALGERLAGMEFAAVVTSPLVRARRTAELAGFGGRLRVDPDLAEWDYGAYEGRRTAEIRRERPGWALYRDGCPGGETAAQVGARVDRVIERLRGIEGDVLVFGHGHCLSVLGVRWARLPAERGGILSLRAAGVSVLGYHHTMDEPVIRVWNADRP